MARRALERELPALAQVGVDVAGAAIVVSSRSGFRKDLVEEVSRRDDVVLVDLPPLLGEG